MYNPIIMNNNESASRFRKLETFHRIVQNNLPTLPRIWKDYLASGVYDISGGRLVGGYESWSQPVQKVSSELAALMGLDQFEASSFNLGFLRRIIRGTQNLGDDMTLMQNDFGLAFFSYLHALEASGHETINYFNDGDQKTRGILSWAFASHLAGNALGKSFQALEFYPTAVITDMHKVATSIGAARISGIVLPSMGYPQHRTLLRRDPILLPINPDLQK